MAECFECGKPAEEYHHVVPKIVGGTKTIPLCSICHGKVHGLSGRAGHTELTKRGLDKKRVAELGATWLAICVEGMTFENASKEFEIPIGRIKNLLKRLNEMDITYQAELLSTVNGITSVPTYKLYRSMHNDGTDDDY